MEESETAVTLVFLEKGKTGQSWSPNRIRLAMTQIVRVVYHTKHLAEIGIAAVTQANIEGKD
jgi:hypothetical protein